MRVFFPGLLVLAVLPATAWAQAPAGAEFQVNTYTTDNQRNPSVASDGSGNFVVVWRSYGQDGSTYGIFGRRFNASGPITGSDFRANAYTTGAQGLPAVASDANGNFVVVWNSDGQDGSSSGVFGQRFNAAGVPQASEFQVNSYTPNYQSSPSVASDADGNFVVVWMSSAQEGGGYAGVFGQRFNASGVPQGAEFHVNSYTTGNQLRPAVSSDPNGNFVVVWDSSGGNDGSDYGVFGQRFDASGARQGPEFRVNSYTTSSQSRAAVASSPDGDFVVVWESAAGNDGNSYGVFGQRYGDLIFEDGFESGDLSRWSSASTDGGNLSVSGAAGLAGTSAGLQAFVNDTNSLFVQDDTPTPRTATGPASISTPTASTPAKRTATSASASSSPRARGSA